MMLGCFLIIKALWLAFQGHNSSYWEGYLLAETRVAEVAPAKLGSATVLGAKGIK